MAEPRPLPEVCVVYLIRDGAGSPEVLLGRKLSGLGEGKVVAPLTYLFPSKPEWSQLSWAFRARGAWLPDLLKGDPVVATFEFGPDLSTVSAIDCPTPG